MERPSKPPPDDFPAIGGCGRIDGKLKENEARRIFVVLKNLFEVNFHLGKDSDRFLREFESKRANYSIREIEGYPVDDLKLLRQSFSQEICTFEAPGRIAV